MQRVKWIVLVVCLSLPLTGLAQNLVSSWDIQLAWDANTEADLAGYRLYHSVGSSFNGVVPYGNSVATIPADTQNFSLPITDPGTHYFLLTAYDESGNESGPSNEVFKTVDNASPSNPVNLNISISISINIGG